MCTLFTADNCGVKNGARLMKGLKEMKTVMALAMTSLLLIPTVSAQTPATPAAPKSVCQTLADDYRLVEENLAQSFVDGLADNSAPRATLRAMEEANGLASAALTVAFMRDNKCPLPKRAPSTTKFLGAALECSTARGTVPARETAPQCVRANWKAAE